MHMRAYAREKNILLGIFGNFFSRLAIHSYQIYFIGFFSRSFNTSWFGVWSLLQQAIIFSSLIDFGFGGGAFRNKLSSLSAANEIKKENNTIFSIVITLSFLLSLIFSIVFVLGSNLFELHWILRFDACNKMESSSRAFTISLILIFLRSSLSVYHSVFYAFQKNHYKSFLEVVSYTVLVMVVFISKKCNANSESLFLIYFLALSISELLSFFAFFKMVPVKMVKISIQEIVNYIRDQGKNSLLFWVQNLTSLFLFSALLYLVNFCLGTEEAGNYNIISRPFLLLLGIHFMILNPLWSSISDAINHKDLRWIRGMFWKGLFMTILFMASGSILIRGFYKPILFWWSGKILENPLLVSSLGIWVTTYSLVNYLSIFLNAVNSIARQALFLSVGAIISIMGGCLFGSSFGAFGIVFVASIGILPLLLSNIIQIHKVFFSNEQSINY